MYSKGTGQFTQSLCAKKHRTLKKKESPASSYRGMSGIVGMVAINLRQHGGIHGQTL
jgi:hypothetical protein